MTDISGDTLRALIRFIPPARALKGELDKIVTTETYAGIGNTVVRSYQRLQARVAEISGDPYVASLSADFAADATDHEKAAFALLSVSQLVAYLEAMVGVVTEGASGPKVMGKEIYQGPKHSIQTGDISATPEAIKGVAAMLADVLKDKGGKPEEAAE